MHSGESGGTAYPRIEVAVGPVRMPFFHVQADLFGLESQIVAAGHLDGGLHIDGDRIAEEGRQR